MIKQVNTENHFPRSHVGGDGENVPFLRHNKVAEPIRTNPILQLHVTVSPIVKTPVLENIPLLITGTVQSKLT